MSHIYNIWQEFLNAITPGHLEGIVMYICGSITMTWIQLHHKKDVVIGLKGDNGMWESPEWLVYQASWLFPQMIMASGFMNVNFPGEVWLFMGGIVMFGLTGRWGLEWLLSIRSGTNVTSNNQTQPKKEEKPIDDSSEKINI